ncbi:MucBP domain-containing protein [Furfurilactobacillus entadae]|uniref:MucBP domain-containing protein n=1 Tax=Furfurilactobacillus entadae TaxID=2922307 RepID=UPI0035F0EBA6
MASKKFKMYKQGKNWVVAATILGSTLALGTQAVKADVTTTPVTAGDTTNKTVATPASSGTVTLSAASQAESSAASNSPSGSATSATTSATSSTVNGATTPKVSVSTAATAPTVNNLGVVSDAVAEKTQTDAANTYATTGQPQMITRTDATTADSSAAGTQRALPAGDTLSDPAFFSKMYTDPNPAHYAITVTAVSDGSYLISSTNRTGDGTVYVYEFAKSGDYLGGYKIPTGQSVTSAHFGFIYRSGDQEVAFDNNHHFQVYLMDDARTAQQDRYYWIPQKLTQTISYVDESGQPIAAPDQQIGMSYQQYTTVPITIPGYTLDQTKLPQNQNGSLSQFVKGWHGAVDVIEGVNVAYQQIDDAGTVIATITDQHLYDHTGTTTKSFTLAYNESMPDAYETNDVYGWPHKIVLANPVVKGSNDVVYVYESNYSITNTKTIHETINYLDTDKNVVAPQQVAQPITFMTVHNSGDNTDTVYYSATATSGTIDPATGIPTGSDWTKGDSATFAAVQNPTVTGDHVISNDAPSSDLTQVSGQTVTSTSADGVYTVVYAKDDTTPSNPDTPGTPSTPTTPTNPVTPSTPAAPQTPSTLVGPATPKTPGVKNTVTPGTPVMTAAKPAPKVTLTASPKQATLPETDATEQPASMGIIAMILGLFSALGLIGGLKRKQR